MENFLSLMRLPQAQASHATFPRYRYDQLMRLGWKVFLPLTLVWMILTAAAVLRFGL